MASLLFLCKIVQMSENELRRECATIHEKDGFCKEPAQKSENEFRKRFLAMGQQYIKQMVSVRKGARQKMNCAFSSMDAFSRMARTPEIEKCKQFYE